MTETEQRVAIAEACGWTGLNENCLDDCVCFDPKGVMCDGAPDYLNDLNACHEMEETLTPEQWSTYSNKLMVVVRDSDPTLNGSNVEARYKAAHAKAAQRCPAFLKTKGLWK